MKEYNSKLYVYDQSGWRSAIEEQYLLTDEPASVTEVEDGIFLPMRAIKSEKYLYANGIFEGGICDKNGKFIAGQLRHHERKEYNRSCIRSYEVSSEDIEKRNETVIFGGVLVSHFGHMLCDSTSRLWYPASHPEDNHKIIFMRFPKQNFPYQDLLELAGIPEDRYEILDKPVQFKKILVPDETFYSGSGRYRREFAKFFDAARNNVTPSPYKKLYLTRTAYNIDNIVGEKYYEQYYEHKGYKVISPEKLSLEEQISNIAGAEEIVATMGTISHLALFANTGTKLTVLNRSQSIIKTQIAINEARGINAEFIDAHMNFLPAHQGGNCIVFLTPNKNWHDYIKNEFGEEPDLESDDLFLKNHILEYIEKWGDFFSAGKSHYKWIRKFDVKDVIKNINKFFFDRDVDTSSYNDIGILADLKKSLNNFKEAGLKICDAKEIYEEGGILFLKGGLTIPFVNNDNININACVEEGGFRFDTPVEYDFDEISETYYWKITIDLQTLCNELITQNKAGTMSLKIFLVVSNDKTKKQIAISHNHSKPEIESDGFEHVYKISNRYLTIVRTQDENVLELKTANASELLGLKSKAYIDNVEQDFEKYVLSGTFRSYIANSDDIKYNLSLRLYKHEDETDKILFDVETKASSDEKDIYWKCIMPKKVLAKHMNATFESKSRWDICLSLSSDEQTREIRIGENRKEGVYDVFEEGCFLTEKNEYAFGMKTGKENFSFEVHNIEDFMKRFFIENFEWQNDKIIMSGYAEFEREITFMPDFKFGLFDEKNKTFIYICDVTNVALIEDEDEKEQLTWHIEASYDNMRDAMKDALHDGDESYIFAISDGQGYKIIGGKRKPGTWDEIKKIPQFIDGCELVPERTSGKEDIRINVHKVTKK